MMINFICNWFSPLLICFWIVSLWKVFNGRKGLQNMPFFWHHVESKVFEHFISNFYPNLSLQSNIDMLKLSIVDQSTKNLQRVTKVQNNKLFQQNKLQMDDKLSELSIKQRLKSVRTSSSPRTKVVYSTSLNKIYAPEHFNYILNNIDNSIQHEDTILKKIKQQIQQLKAKRKTSVKIKNSYDCDQRSLNSKVFKKHRAVCHSNQPIAAQSVNVFKKTSQGKSDNNLFFSNITHFFQEEQKLTESTADPACFQRSGISTPNRYSQQSTRYMTTSTLIGNQQNIPKSKVSKRSTKKSQLSVTGGQPIWRQFESYYKTSQK